MMWTGILDKQKKQYGWALRPDKGRKILQDKGWKEVGKHGKKEIKFEMSYEAYKDNLKKTVYKIGKRPSKW